MVLVFLDRQCLLHRPELFQGGFEALHDLGGEEGGSREVVAVFEGIVLEPEDVEVGFVAGDDLGVGEFLEALGFLALGDGSGVIDGFEVVEVLVGEGIGLEGEVLVGAEVVDPEVFGPGLFAGFLALEEEDVGFDALGVEDAGG